MTNQLSCRANIRNVGNFYTWYAASTNSQGVLRTENSVCPTGWQIPSSTVDSIKSYYALIAKVYEAKNGKETIEHPFSLIYTGFYHESGDRRNTTDQSKYMTSDLGSFNSYLTYVFYAYNSGLDTQLLTSYGGSVNSGTSLRCVALC